MTTFKPNRFFVDCHVFDAGFQGTRTYIKGLYSVLIKDTSKHFFLGAYDIDNLKNEFGEAANITYIKYPKGNKIKRLLIDLPRILRKHKIDYAHFQYRVPPIKVCKYIVTTHDVLFEDFPEHFPKMNRISSLYTYKYSAKISDIVFTVSGYSKQEIKQYLGVDDAVIMPNGVDAPFFETYDKKTVETQILATYGISDYLIYISRLEPRKNQHLLLQHFIGQNLYESNHLVFIGHETFKNPELHAIYDNLQEKVKAKVTFIENVAFSEMLQLLRGAKAFVYPSIAEGFGIPPLEAAAAKIPVLCSSDTAMADFDFFGENLFNPSDAIEFQRKLLRIAKEDPDENHLETIRKTVALRYNWENAAEIFNTAVAKTY